MPNYRKRERLAYAATLLHKYESNTVKTNDSFRKDTINRLVYWLSIYTAEQIDCAIERYFRECADMVIKRRYMRRSHNFFDGNKLVSGFFESYIDGGGSKCHNTKLKIHANDCFQSFKVSGGCGDYLKEALSYCKFCAATNMKIHQTGVLADFDFRGDENASTRPKEPKIMEQCSAVGERQPMY